uniref:Ig-like domain-containing protein n=1 Tax=Chelonoidis abingdonii TaxID=106734 RepID=A0A8C0IXJ8_CHEAB
QVLFWGRTGCFWLFLHFLGIIISQALTPHRQVNGVLGGSSLLSVDLLPEKNVNKIEWSFRAGSGVTIQVAEFNGGKFERPDPSDRFKQRLEKYNETSLRIKVLELGDHGVYEARIKIVPATVEEQAFLLAVYEPVPAPEIKSHSLSNTAAGCNVTLQCEVSVREEVNVSWRRGNPPQDLGNLERYQLTPDGRTLHLSLQPNPPDSTFTCTASNPGDQKSISLDLQSMCQSRGEGFTACPNLAFYCLLRCPPEGNDQVSSLRGELYHSLQFSLGTWHLYWKVSPALALISKQLVDLHHTGPRAPAAAHFLLVSG